MLFRDNSIENYTATISSKNYRKISIPKSKSKFRLIYIPSPVLALELRKLLPELEGILEGLDCSLVNYGFTKGKNCALNAFQHIGKRYSLSFDLQDFFDTITISHVEKLIPRQLIDKCFVDGGPRQGLPTSPIISSIAFTPCDEKILNLLRSFEIDAIYTRYADDLTFGFNEPRDAEKIELIVRKVLFEHGFILNGGCRS